MYKLIRNNEGVLRQIAPNKTANNLITKDINPHLSLALIEATEFKGIDTTDYNRIYYVLEGILILNFDGESISLNRGDSCYIEEHTTFKMSGTFKALNINQPSFGTR